MRPGKFGKEVGEQGEIKLPCLPCPPCLEIETDLVVEAKYLCMTLRSLVVVLLDFLRRWL